MPVTSRWAIPYPLVSDPPDLPAQAEALAVSVDNMAKDDQGPLSARPVSNPGQIGKLGRYYFANDEGVLYRDFGSGWSPGYIAEMGLGVPGVGATDYTYFNVLMDTTAGVVWKFRYKAEEALYKWLFVGGPALDDFVPNSDEQINSSSLFNWLTGSRISVPRPGIYEIDYGGNMYNSTPDCGEHLSFRTQNAESEATMLENSVGMYTHSHSDPDASSIYAHLHTRRFKRYTINSAGNVELVGRQVNGGTARFRGRTLSIRPLQLM